MTNVAKRRQGDGQAVMRVKRSSPVTSIERMPTGCSIGKATRGAGHGDRVGGSAGVQEHGMPGDGWVEELGKPTGVSPQGE